MEKKEESRDFGRALQRQRKEKGITLSELAEKTNVSDTAISRYETGKRLPNIITGCLLAQSLGCTVEELIKEMTWEEEETMKKNTKYYVTGIYKNSEKSDTVPCTSQGEALEQKRIWEESGKYGKIFINEWEDSEDNQ